MRHLAPVLFAVLAVVALGAWYGAARRLSPRALIEERVATNDPPEIVVRIPPEFVVAGSGTPAPEIAGEYPAYRGSRGTAIIDTGLAYDFDWRSHPPVEQWRHELGIGHSGFAVKDGKVYLQDYDHRNFFVVCRSEADLTDLLAFVDGFAFGDPERREMEEILTERERHTWQDASGQDLADPVALKAARDAFGRLLRKELDIAVRYDRTKTFLGPQPLPGFLAAGCPTGLAYEGRKRDAVDWVVRLWERRRDRTVARVHGWEDMVRCLSLADGREIWRNSYHENWKPVHGYTRGTPSVTADRVVALGPRGLLVCLDAATGRRVWDKDIRAEYGSEIPTWENAQSPLIVPNPVDPARRMVLLAPCGTKGGRSPGFIMVALDLETGKHIWGAPNRGGWKLSHATPVLMEVDGIPVAVYCAQGGTVAVTIKGGRILWSTGLWQVKTATVTVPVDCGEGRIFVSGGYQSGSKMLQWYRAGEDRYEVRELWSLPPTKEGFECEQHGPLLIGGFLYGVNSNGDSHRLVCLDPSTGAVRWQAESPHEFYLSPYFATGDHIWVLRDKGKDPAPLVVFSVSPTGARAVAELRCTRGENAYAMMTLAGDRLLVRDQNLMQCFRLAVKP
jgi:outer membrane protein assembly factor BamB